MVVIRGMNVFPSAIEQAIREAGVLGEYRIRFYTETAERDEIRVLVEATDPALVRTIEARIFDRLSAARPRRPGDAGRAEGRATQGSSRRGPARTLIRATLGGDGERRALTGRLRWALSEPRDHAGAGGASSAPTVSSRSVRYRR